MTVFVVLLLVVLAPLVPSGEAAADLPSPQEVECLHLVNRFRADPAGEGRRLMRGGRVGYPEAPFGIDLRLCRTELAELRPVAPLVMDLHLLASARGHAGWMIANDQCAHVQAPGTPGFTGADPLARMALSGFTGLAVGENCYAGSLSPRQAVVGYVIDWGAGDGQLLPGRPHRHMLLSETVDLVGTAMVPRTGGFSSAQNFGHGRSGRPAGGVVYVDRNRNGRFDAGEGVGGVAVRGATVSTTTWPSGGWALELPSSDAGEISFELAGQRESVAFEAGRAALAVDWPMPQAEDARLLDRLEAATRVAGPAGRSGRINAAFALDRLVSPRARVQALAGLCAEERIALAADQERVRDAVWWDEHDAALAVVAAAASRWQGSDAAAWFSGAGEFAKVHAKAIAYMAQMQTGRPTLGTVRPALRREVAQLRQRQTCVEWQEACDRIEDVLATIQQRRL